MKIKEKIFTQGKPYDDKGNIYYKPLEKFAKFGTSGVRWFVAGASAVLSGTPERISYYISNKYVRNVGGKDILAEDFNLPNASMVIKAIALYNLQRSEEFKKKLSTKGLLVMYDNRPGNFVYAEEAAKILAAYSIKAVLTRSDGKFIPTPLSAVSRLVQEGGYAGSITFTASHNGDEWNGIKFEADDGAAAQPKITDAICAILMRELALKDPDKSINYNVADENLEALIKEGKVATIDTLDFYANSVSKYLDIKAIKKAINEGRVEFIYSAFFGSSGQAMLKLFAKLRLPINNIIETQKQSDRQYISSYEPTLEKLKKLVYTLKTRGEEIKKNGLKTIVIGGAADNDADRFQVSQYNDATGNVDEFTPGKLAAVLGHYLCRYKKFRGPFGRSFVTSSLQDEVARLFGEATIETATGFKFSPRVFVENKGVIFTEESYGLSFKGWTLDKDGILPSLLALELVSVTGKSLNKYYEEMLAELEKAGLNAKKYFKRYDMPLDKELQTEAISRFTELFNGIVEGKTVFNRKTITYLYNPKDYEGGMKFVMQDGSWMALRSSGTEPLIRLYIEAGSERERELLKTAALKLMGLQNLTEKQSAAVIGQKLHTPLVAASSEAADKFMQGGYNQPGYGVPVGAALDGSFAIGNEGNQGYYVNGGKEIFLNTVKSMREFFSRRARILGKPIRYVIKPGIGGQHTLFQGIAGAFHVIDAETGIVVGEYELGKDYESSITAVLGKLGVGWSQIAVIPSSKSGSTDETMMIFTDILYAMLKNTAAQEGLSGETFAKIVLNTMNKVNFINGKEVAAKNLFKGFNLSLVQENLKNAGINITLESVKKIFGIVLGNMFFETTDRPEQSRLSAFIRNSGLDKELGENAPGFGAMFDNVGGRWTADLHMMTFLAYYGLNAEEYWNTRYEGIKKVREGTHEGVKLANKILNEGITDIALVVPDELFWFGKAIEQNFNESIWQEGFANLIAIQESTWEAQKSKYTGKASRMVINISALPIQPSSGNVANIGEFKLQGITKQELANSLGELFTTFYGTTYTVGNRLIARALAEEGYTPADVDLNNLNNPATKIVQRNLYLRQPYVELGKGLVEKRLKTLQKKGPAVIEEELARIIQAAREGRIESNIPGLNFPALITGIEELAGVINGALRVAQKENRKFVPFIYLEGKKFLELREQLVNLGIEWVMQGTGDQHISYQQVLAQPQKYLPFIISFVTEKTLPGRPAIGFAKGYLNNVSPNMVRDLFAEASYKALIKPRNNEAGEEVKGAAGIFLSSMDTNDNRNMLAQSFDFRGHNT